MGRMEDVGVVAGAIGVIIGLVVSLVGLVFLGMFVAMGIWYANDDWLAAYTGVPEIGQVPFWRAFLTYWMVVLMFKGSGAVSSVLGGLGNRKG